MPRYARIIAKVSLDFGLREFGVAGKSERLRLYRKYVYEAGGVAKTDDPGAKTINKKIIESEHKKGFKITRIDRFQNRTRYFTDSGIIGTRKFVSTHYEMFKDCFVSKKEKVSVHRAPHLLRWRALEVH